MEKKQEDTSEKEKKMMERSTVRRNEYMKSVSSSFYKSSDKLHHLKERSDQELHRSFAIFAEYQSKIEAASQRKKHYVSETKESAKDMNNQIEVAHSFWN